MGILLPLLLATHEPVHGTIKCDGWKELASEVRQDEYLDEQSKSDLILSLIHISEPTRP